jgi:hypothetical protein
MGRGFSSEADWSMSMSRNGLIWILAGALFAQAAIGEPLDLQDKTSRWIEVRFEVSPSDEPGRLDSHWSSVRAAYLESDSDSSIVRIRIPTAEIEAHLRTTGTEAVPGSFSDFVWTLDSTSGHVLAAELTGRVRERFSFGMIRTSALVDIRVEMTTHEVGGFLPDKGIFGLRTNAYCSPAPALGPSGCIAVSPVRFDPDSGYVNAVGTVVAATRVAKIRAFSPLGEVQFHERRIDGTETVVSGTSRADALCSAGFNGPCWPDLGGES